MRAGGRRHADLSDELSALTDLGHPPCRHYAHPTAQLDSPPGFFAFTANQISHECTYDNPGGTTLHAGDSEFPNEVCYAIAYFFPATHPSLRLNAMGPL